MCDLGNYSSHVHILLRCQPKSDRVDLWRVPESEIADVFPPDHSDPQLKRAQPIT